MKDYIQEITAHWSRINRLAVRRFGEGSLAEEAALYVLEQLKEGDGRRLRAFNNRSSFATFITAVILRLLEDFSRSRFGRVRPPTWITGLGGIWVALFELLCLQRLNVSDAVQTLLSRRPGVDEHQLEDNAWTILEKVVDCGKHQGLEVELDEQEGPVAGGLAEGGAKTPEGQLAAGERQLFFEVLFAAQNGAGCDTAFGDRLQQAITLSDEERLLLKLCFQDDLSVTRAGKMLGLNANQAHGKLRRLLTRLRSGFERAGISDDLQAMLRGEAG